MFARQEFGRPLLAPPGVPSDRLAALRKAFMSTMKDPDFLKDAAQMRIAVDQPMNGEDLAKFVAQLHATPKAVIDRIQTILTKAR